MKYFFYTVFFLASLGTIGAVMNPPLAKKWAAFAGIDLFPGSDHSSEPVSADDQIKKFMDQYATDHSSDRSREALHADASRYTPDIPPLAPPASVPIPPVSAMPVAMPPAMTPEPASVPAAPPVASAWNNGNPTPPVSDNFSSEAVSPLTPLPVQENVPAPAPSVYAAVMSQAPPQDRPPLPEPLQETPPPAPAAGISDPFAASYQPVHPAGFAPVNETPPPAAPPVPPNPPNPPTVQVPPSSIQTPSMLIEDVHCPGTETVARVGTQVILMCDILPKIRRTAIRVMNENLKRMPPEERAKIAPEEIDLGMNAFIESCYPSFLQEQVLLALIYNDYVLSKVKAERDHFDARIGEEFDRNEVPAMMKEFGTEDLFSLKNYLKEKLGSSLERERMLWIRERIAQQWIAAAAQKATNVCNHDEMHEFYEKNMSMFTAKAKARWQEMVVLTSRHKTEDEAMKKICWMGNQVQSGAPFEEIAKANSDGATASGGGVWDWTAKGSLTSPELEQAVFSQPIGSLSPAIIKTEKGLHIIKVLEREEAKITPFIDAQVVIREQIRNQRGQRYQDEYIAELRRKFPAEILKDKIDLKGNVPSSAQTPYAVQR
ncbi:MAG: peptidylprolyl isomerase [Planctomycetaceae bacterium]|nr:peptidylprolyl isomerase [Planctomycetaceae bacterium]